MTFTVTDALMSPMGLAVLTGAGLIKPNKDKQAHFHLALNGIASDATGTVKISFEDIRDELGLGDMKAIDVCNTIEMFATKLDGSGAGIDWYNTVTIDSADEYVTVEEDGDVTFKVSNVDGNDTTYPAKGDTIQVDFYVLMNNSVTEVQIAPESFGGYFYIEAQTLFRREDTGKDMAAELIIPKAKVQSAFTFTMAASGDPSTFNFVMDAMPGYTRFDSTKKQMCVIQIVGTDKTGDSESGAHVHEDPDENDSPSFKKPDVPTPSIDITGSGKVGTSTIPAGFPFSTEYQANQGAMNVTVTSDEIAIKVDSIADLEKWTSTDPGQAALGDQPWLAIDISTGIDDITKLTYNGSALTSSDVADAAAWGLGDGHIILWIRANAVSTTPKSITLAGDGFDPVTFTVSVTEV